jgi:hypothetical protein
VFKRCTVCQRSWPDRDGFLSDPALVLIGYQVNFDDLEAGLLLFNHMVPGCRTTLAIDAAAFSELYDGPVFEERKTGTAECPGYCRHRDDLSPCPAQCACAYLREILPLIQQWPKRAA